MYLPAPPSPLRLPVAIVLGLVAPPLGAIAWIALSGSHRPLYWRSGWIRAGLFLIIGTALPLLAVVVATAMGLTSDPNPNPIGLGLLFFFGGIVGMVLIIIGIIVTARQESRAAERNELGLC
jgi:hypothetical protein